MSPYSCSFYTEESSQIDKNEDESVQQNQKNPQPGFLKIPRQMKQATRSQIIHLEAKK